MSSADGVGTKLKVAFMTGRHDTVGADLVNHCVNDILVQGAEPLFFLDYLATGRLSPDVAEQVVQGMARGCRENGCALLGGETAEMPGFYADGEYDLAGFIVGVVERDASDRRPGDRAGDVLIGLPSTGLHTNGYSLARHVAVRDAAGCRVGYVTSRNSARRSATRCWRRTGPICRVIKPLLERRLVKGMAHITGGGITDNLPRMLPEACAAVVDRQLVAGAAALPLVCSEAGAIADDEMFRAFNMGIGLILVVRARDTSTRSCRRARGMPARRGADRHRARRCRRRTRFATVVNRRLGVLISGPRQQSSGDHRRDRSGTPRRRDRGRHLEPAGRAGTRPRARGGIEPMSSTPQTIATATRLRPRARDVAARRDVGLVCLAGFMRLVGPALARRVSEPRS